MMYFKETFLHLLIVTAPLCDRFFLKALNNEELLHHAHTLEKVRDTGYIRLPV
jgi:hypothetical protein